MPPRGFKCRVEVSIESVSSPGTWLPNRDDLYLTLEFFSQAKRTRLVEPSFPLCLHERFVFEKVFWPASDPQDVLEMLDELAVTIELRQVTDVYLGGCLLAYYDIGARDFLYPAPGASTAAAIQCGSRQVQMVRTVDFIGPGPRLEFATRASIVEDFAGPLDEPQFVDSDDLEEDEHTGPPRSLRSRSKRRAHRLPGYGRQTLATVLRSRSPGPYAAAAATAALRYDYEPPSPSRRRRCPPLPQSQVAPVRVDGRPPFVVRRVDKALVGRKPVLHDTFTRLGGPRGPLRSPQHARGLRRSTSSVELHHEPPRAGRPVGEEFEEDLGDYRPLSPHVSGRTPRFGPSLLPPPPPPRYRGGSPLRHRLYGSFYRDNDELYGDEEEELERLNSGLRRVRIRDSWAY